MSRQISARRLYVGLRGLTLRFYFARHVLFKLTVAVSLGGASITPVAHSDGMTYATGLGETRSIPFADGSALCIDALTTILVKEGGDRRTVYLDQGQMQAMVVHGKSKPLDVVVHGGYRVQRCRPRRCHYRLHDGRKDPGHRIAC